MYQPDGSITGSFVKHNKKNVFNTTMRKDLKFSLNFIDGEHKICVSLTDGVYAAMNENLK